MGIATFYEARAPLGNAFHDTIWLLVALSLAGLALTPFLGRTVASTS
ncbi:hypothetical protein GCM10009555_090840 [Acrocarpospora macrocephala]|uniref:Uncharacterized protein n=1 Tax=Acrocarpospora macrocephala TaxID=150177 RepID=A0A5M3WKS8_9ACTN|nr:hypothetical protein [Acrocarpospora macrocephala]GES09060.1 hypothetical protein Amac_026560 [Acrocarpospora macrocephala]